MNKLYNYRRIENPYTRVVWIANPDNAAIAALCSELKVANPDNAANATSLKKI